MALSKKTVNMKALRKERLSREGGGIVLMLVSLFIMGAVLSYHAEDEAVIQTLPWYDIYSAAAKAVAETIHNPFGLFGARISVFFVRSIFGYPSLIPILALLFWGWHLLRMKSLKPAILFLMYALLISLDMATMFGLTNATFGDVMAGATGRMVASFLSTVIGFAGAWVLLAASALLLTFYMGRGLFSRWFAYLNAVMAKVAQSWQRRQAERMRRRKVEEEKKAQKKAAMQEAALKKEQKKNAVAAASAAARKRAEQELTPQPALQPEPAPEPLPVSPAVTLKEPPVEVAPEYSPEEEMHEPAFPAPLEVGGPEMIINKGVHEKEADLDERRLKVKTRDRVPYRFPSIDLLQKPMDDDGPFDERHLAESKNRLLEKLSIYKIDVVKIATTVGPRVTLFELELAPDVKISRIKSLENDLAMALAARGIRIIAPIPGKNAVGVEIPNAKAKTVMMRSVLQVEKFKNSTMTLPIVLGKTISNEVLVDDLATMPHLLIAGATGAGKSVAINVILTSLLYAKRPDELKLVLIDPKRVELFQYQHLKNHFLAKFPGFDEQIVTDPQKAVLALRSVVREMERRYEILEKCGVRNIGDYNRKLPDDAMYYLVVVIDELADLMITAGREVEEPIIRIAQLARAVGIHLIVATQRPSVDIITGIIKANFPSRIAFQVASKVDSRTILDVSGADQLLGNGDMLFQPASLPKPIRVQCPFVSSAEVEAITSFIGSQPSLKDAYVLPVPDTNNGSSSGSGQDRDGRDSMFEEAARLIVIHQQASVSLLQRRLRLGFSRAGRIMDQLQHCGIVSAGDGSKPREVLVKNEDSLELLLRNLD
jgi:S-DNA-T family DNA segregation ATPase FtsK/SpoIIIE